MGLERTRLEFGKKLASQKPRVVANLNDFYVRAVGCHAREIESMRDEDVFVLAIEFVAVPVPL